MKLQHIKAVFKAEYYTTTSKFRKYRTFIPFLFLGGVIIFSYILRVIYELFRGEQFVQDPPLPTFFSIIAIFSYFTLFAPLLSPLGRVVYDGGARSRREVALNAPVTARDLLYGNLLSNLAFFLPFFGFIGTLTLAPFIGSGLYSPLITSLALFAILSILILVGLVAGTLVSPIIFNFITSQENSQSRAVVAFGVSAMLVFSLPILRYFLEHTTLEGNLGPITFLPFTLAAILIIYILYGISISISPTLALGLLLGYIVVIFILGYLVADILYEQNYKQNKFTTANPETRGERLLQRIIRPFPPSIGKVISSTMKASIRDIEHLARLTIGIAITIFMIFALSSRGLFRDTTNFNQQIELAVIVFALVLSSASVIFIETSSFTVQHRDMLSLIKSSPNGARKFVIGKAIQMMLLLTPIFMTIIFVLTGLDFLDIRNTPMLILIVILVVMIMTSLSMAIYLVNPSDNEEDLGNFINLLVFYVFGFMIAVIPIILIVAELTIPTYVYILIALGSISLSGLFLYIASQALEEMNLETLDSTFSRSILQGFKTVILFFITWNFLPLLGLSYLLRTNDPIGYIILSYVIILTSVVLYYFFSAQNFSKPKITVTNFQSTIRNLVVMLGIGIGLSFIQSYFYENNNLLGSYSLLGLNKSTLLLIISLLVFVEELFFRGMIFDYSRKEMSFWGATSVNAILFGLLHILTPISFINAVIQTYLLCQLKEDTQSVFFTILAHLGYNLILVSILFM